MSLALAHQFAKMGDVLPCNLGRYRRLRRWSVWFCWRTGGWCWLCWLALSRPCIELAPDGPLDDAEQVTRRIADGAAVTAGHPFVEHGLAHGLIYLLEGDHRACLLFFLQAREAVGQDQAIRCTHARYCTYFIDTFITYCTARLRNPKAVV